MSYPGAISRGSYVYECVSYENLVQDIGNHLFYKNFFAMINPINYLFYKIYKALLFINGGIIPVQQSGVVLFFRC